MKLSLITIALTTFLLLNSCKTDFDINAEWKEFTVVYGLLDQSQKDQYIRISKAFLGEGNVNVMASNPDSTNYGNVLEVWIEEWRNNSMSNVWYLDTITVFNKEGGVFSYPKQLMYWFHADTLYEDATYKIYIQNTESGKRISGETPLVHGFSVIKPMSGQFLNMTATNPVDIKWITGEFGKLYQIEMEFSYWEKKIGETDSTLKSLRWNLGSYTSDNIEGGQSMTADYYGQNFYKFLHDNIEESDLIQYRNASGLPLKLIFSVASEDFNTYMEVNAPSTGIAQDKPQYTNISNGIGLFASRFHLVHEHYLTAPSMDSLKNGHYTRNLDFL